MSEYQYYEFQALDRPLDAREMEALRAVSTRATITPTGFVNYYEWGDFKGDPAIWMARYFDAFLYLANWGTHEFMLRLPRHALDLEAARACCCGAPARVRTAGDFVVLAFRSEDEHGDDWDDGSGRLSSLVPLRAEIAAGDHRALYLAWLLCLQEDELGAAAMEPPVPPGLGRLSPALEAFGDFLRIDPDLVAAAAERSPEIDEVAHDRELRRWVAALPDAEKIELLLRAVSVQGPGIGAELLRRFRARHPAAAVELPASRSVAELTAAAERLGTERRRREAEQAARERARRAREEAARRAAYLNELAGREAESWREVDALIAARQPRKYDDAVRLLKDLQDLGLRDGRAAEVTSRVRALHAAHASKPSFVDRLRKAGLADLAP